MRKKLFTLMTLLLTAVTGAWAADLEIPLTNLKNFPLDYGLVQITNTSNTTISSNQLQVSKKTGTFKVSTKVDGVYLKTISFTDANSTKNGGFTCTDNTSYMTGPSENVYTYTAPNTTTTEANFQLIGSGGTAKMGTIIITISTSDEVERLTAFGSISENNIPFTSSATTSNLTLSVPASNGVTTGSSRISIGSGGKHLVVSTKNNKVIKYIAIPKYQQSTESITCTSTPTGTYSDNVWTASSIDVKTTDLTLTTSTTVYTQEIYVLYEDAPAIHDITLDKNGGDSDGAATVAEGGNKLTITDAPVKAGHAVAGYYKEAGLTNLIADASGNLQASTDYTDAEGKWTSTSNQTLYAKWEVATYTLNVETTPAGYGTVDVASITDIPYNTTTSSSTNTITVNGTTVTASPTAATAEYTYAFDSWSGLPANVTEDATVTANFTRTPVSYTLAWDANGGDALTGTYSTGTTAFGTELTEPNEPTRSGFVFDRWNTAADGTGEDYTGTMPAANTIYYAQWIAGESSKAFNYADGKTISQLESAGWTFNSAEFDADPTDEEAYANLVSAMTTEGLTAPGNNSMASNAIAFTKNTDAYAMYDLGAEVTVLKMTATLYGGSSSSFDQKIQYIGADGTTVKKEYTNKLNAGNWEANKISKTESVDGVRYIKVFGASKWVVMYDLSVTHSIGSTIAIKPAKAMTTFSSAKALDFTGSELKAYVVSNITSDAVTLTAVTDVPAEKGLILVGTAGTTYDINVGSATTLSVTNYLKAAVTATLLAADYAYVLSNGKFVRSAAGTLPAGKAYLLKADIDTAAGGAPEMGIVFDDNSDIATSIENIESPKSIFEGEFYNLNGQRVSQPTKGLYIVNGKKVIVK